MPKLSADQALKINIDGKALERAGHVDEAIRLYEHGVANNSDTPHTYTRLMILYRKAKRLVEEKRVCEVASRLWPEARDGLGNVSPSSFVSRLARIEELIRQEAEKAEGEDPRS